MTRLNFWDVDTQHDFMRPGGQLYVPGSEEIIPTVGALTDYAHRRGIRIIASADDHVEGHRKIPETALRDSLVIAPDPQDPEAVARKVGAHHGDILLHKHSIDVFTNANVDATLRVLDPEVIVLYGVALDVSARYAVEGLLNHRPATRLYVVMDATRAINRDLGEQLLREWGDEGVRLIKSADILEDDLLDKYIGPAGGTR